MTPRQQARAAGLKRYLGEPCLNGHRGLRYVTTRNCVDCERDRRATERLAERAYRADYRRKNRARVLTVERAARRRRRNKQEE